MPIEARRHGAEVLDAIEKVLDPVAELVDFRAERWRVDTVIERSNICVSALLSDFWLAARRCRSPGQQAECGRAEGLRACPLRSCRREPAPRSA